MPDMNKYTVEWVATDKVTGETREGPLTFETDEHHSAHGGINARAFIEYIHKHTWSEILNALQVQADRASRWIMDYKQIEWATIQVVRVAKKVTVRVRPKR